MIHHPRRTHEVALQAACQHAFNLRYGELCTIVALVTGYRLWGLPLLAREVDAVVQNCEGRSGNYLSALRKKGFAVSPGKTGASKNVPTWIPTAKALALIPEIPDGPSIAKVRERVAFEIEKAHVLGRIYLAEAS